MEGRGTTGSVTDSRGGWRERRTFRIWRLSIPGIFTRFLVEQGRDEGNRYSPYSCKPVR